MKSKYKPDGPTPFVKPLLEIRCNDRRRTTFFIDVNGKIDAFIDPITGKGTSELMTLCRIIRLIGFTPTVHRPYYGSGGPGHIYKNGILFSRMVELENKPLPEAPTTVYSEF